MLLFSKIDCISQWLKGVTRKSEQILTAARLCRKLQTDHEIAGKLKDNEPLLMYSEATESPRMNKVNIDTLIVHNC